MLVEVEYCDKFYMRGRLLDAGPFDSLVFDGEFATKSALKTSPSQPKSIKSVSFSNIQSAKETNLLRKMVGKSLALII